MPIFGKSDARSLHEKKTGINMSNKNKIIQYNWKPTIMETTLFNYVFTYI